MKNDIRALFLPAVAIAIVGISATVIPASAQQQSQTGIRAMAIEDAAAKATPRTSDGKPNLSGLWMNPPSDNPRYFPGPTYSDDGKTLILGGEDVPKQDEGAQARFRARAADPTRRPKYKPEHVRRQRELMFTSSTQDPALSCISLGVPRVGAPYEIAQLPDVVYLMYPPGTGMGGFRVVPIGAEMPNLLEDSRKLVRDEPLAHEPTPYGVSVGEWEGDTLVVESTYFDPDTWLDKDGSFHSENMRVVETFTRKGDTLEYGVTVYDDYFQEPFKPVFGHSEGSIGARTLLADHSGDHLIDNYPCIDRGTDHKVNNDRF